MKAVQGATTPTTSIAIAGRVGTPDATKILVFLLAAVLPFDSVSVIPRSAGWNLFAYQLVSVLTVATACVSYRVVWLPSRILCAYAAVVLQSVVLFVAEASMDPTIVKEVVQLLLLVALCVGLYNFASRHLPTTLDFLRAAFAIWLASAGVFYVLHFATGSTFGVFVSDYLPVPRLTGLNADPNVFGIYLLTFLPVVAWSTRKSVPRAALVLAAGVLVSLTLSRANGIILAAYVVLILLGVGRSKSLRLREKLLLLACMTIAAVVALRVEAVRAVAELRLTQLAIETSVASYSRFGIWRDAITYWLSEWVLGVGLERPRLLLGRFVHNTFLELLLSCGIFALPLLALYVYYPLRHLRRAIVHRSRRDLAFLQCYVLHILCLSFVSLVIFEPTVFLFVLSESSFRSRSSGPLFVQRCFRGDAS